MATIAVNQYNDDGTTARSVGEVLTVLFGESRAQEIIA